MSNELWQIPDWVIGLEIIHTPFVPDDCGMEPCLCRYCGEFYWDFEAIEHMESCEAPGIRTYSVNHTSVLELDYG